MDCIAMHKLFPCPPSNNYNLLQIDLQSTMYITTPANSMIISAIIERNLPEHKSTLDLTIMDCTACVGGDTITFGGIFGKVISVELDINKYNMLVNNIKEYEMTNITTINDNCLKLYTSIEAVDIMYFDPPWGGKGYKYKKNLRLCINSVYIDEIVNQLFGDTMKSKIKMAVFKLPKNYDIYDLWNRTKNKPIYLSMYELDKMLILIFVPHSINA